ncbi:hypothetical protein [Mycobacterium sp.]|uniref:hypothetical protein n=1 Tax=Mycobacterium sp. TaxID=1785 RepID=UPI00257E8970|nr:hypothetical protein [Mycobacterium sp.]
MSTADTGFRRTPASSGIPRRRGAAENFSRTKAQPREELPMAYETLFCETENSYCAPAFHAGDAE